MILSHYEVAIEAIIKIGGRRHSIDCVGFTPEFVADALHQNLREIFLFVRLFGWDVYGWFAVGNWTGDDFSINAMAHRSKGERLS